MKNIKPTVYLFNKEFSLDEPHSWFYEDIAINYYKNLGHIQIKSCSAHHIFFYDTFAHTYSLQQYLDSNQNKILLEIANIFDGKTLLKNDPIFVPLVSDIKELISEEQLNKLLILI
jgi:hypothetical protein